MSEPGVQPWKSRPIFISSTFRDMQAERDHLRHFVLPRLEEELRKRRHHVEWIDLRQGVESGEAATEEQRELVVLKVCLDEVRRSRPFLIVLLGDRYGWVPPADRMDLAAREADFQAATSGKSVTALEIEFGILKESPDQQRRCFVYIREPLPYGQMPPELRSSYSEEFAGDPGASARRSALDDLKRRLAEDPELGPRLRRYRATWDPKTNAVTALEAWGNRVFADLWTELDAETREFAGKPFAGWPQLERNALDEFVEQYTRNFTGRRETIEQILAIARSPTGTGVPWAACVTGPSGSGKSSVFAQLHRELKGQSGVLLLANAAGATEHGSSVDFMLRRWIGELAGFLDVPDPLGDTRNAEDVEQHFASLLNRACARKRVVLLIDALNQFEQAPRARYLAWRPKLWPSNARLLVTAQPGGEVESLSRWPGVQEIELAPMVVSDAQELARAVVRRWHVPWNASVWRLLAEKKLPDGSLATSSPLWTTLASEQLALLDAHDFARADQEFAGEADPQARLERLRLHLAGQMPPDVPGLYEWLFQQTQTAHGNAWTQSFAAAIALSRRGWRERDLQNLVPCFAAELFPSAPVGNATALKLAELRRAFRAHIRAHGDGQLWDFAHTQMRLTMDRLVLADPARRGRLHRVVCQYLEHLDVLDPVRMTEFGWHLLGSGDQRRAASYYSRLATLVTPLLGFDGRKLNFKEMAPGEAWDALATEFKAAVGAMATHLIEGEQPDGSNRRLDDVIGWLSLKREDFVGSGDNFGVRLLFGDALNDALGGSDRIRLRLLKAKSDWFHEGSTSDDPATLHNNAVSLIALGDQQNEADNLTGATQSYEKALAIAEKINRDQPNPSYRRNVGLAHDRLGNAASRAGEMAEAEKHFNASLGIFDRLHAEEPSEKGYHCDVADEHRRLGDLERKRENYPGAMGHYAKAIDILEGLHRESRGEEAYLYRLAQTLTSAGDFSIWSGTVEDAKRFLEKALAASEDLMALTPNSVENQLDHAYLLSKMSDVSNKANDMSGVLGWALRSLEMREKVYRRHPTNPRVVNELLFSFCKVAAAYLVVGQHEPARAFRVRCLEFAQEVGQSGMTFDPGAAESLVDFIALEQPHLRQVLRPESGSTEDATASGKTGVILPAAGLAAALAHARSDLGDVYFKQGNVEKALGHFEAGLAGMAAVAENEPGSLHWTYELGQHHMRLAVAYLAAGRRTEAAVQAAAFREVLTRLEKVAPAPPELVRAVEGLEDLFRATETGAGEDSAREQPAAEAASGESGRVGNLLAHGETLVAQGDLAAALEAFQSARTLALRLAATEASDNECRHDLALSHLKVGEVLGAQDDVSGALSAYREALAVSKTLAAADPANTAWQLTLGVSHTKLGEQLMETGDLDGALAAFRESAAIDERLVAADPSNFRGQRNLYVSWLKVGDALCAQGDYSAAQSAYRTCHATSVKLAAADSFNAESQRDLAGALQRLATTAAKAGDETEASARFRECHAVLRAIHTKGMALDPNIAAVLSQFDQAAESNYARLVQAAARSPARLRKPEESGGAAPQPDLPVKAPRSGLNASKAVLWLGSLVALGSGIGVGLWAHWLLGVTSGMGLLISVRAAMGLRNALAYLGNVVPLPRNRMSSVQVGLPTRIYRRMLALQLAGSVLFVVTGVLVFLVARRTAYALAAQSIVLIVAFLLAGAGAAKHTVEIAPESTDGT